MHLLGVAVTAGVGFTVALFVANLAFTSPALIEVAKLGIMVGSVGAACLGYAILRLSARLPNPEPPEIAQAGADRA